MKIILTKIIPLFTVAILFMILTAPAQADCTGQIYNKMRVAHSFKLFKTGANNELVEVQSGDLPIGGSATINYKTAYGRQVVTFYTNGQNQASFMMSEENLANCTWGNSGGGEGYCSGIPRDQDITLMSKFKNCGKSN